MPLYEDRNHAQNKIQFDPELAAQIVIGFRPAIKEIVNLAREMSVAKNRPVTLAFDGYYGIDWRSVIDLCFETADEADLSLEASSINEVWDM